MGKNFTNERLQESQPKQEGTPEPSIRSACHPTLTLTPWQRSTEHGAGLQRVNLLFPEAAYNLNPNQNQPLKLKIFADPEDGSYSVVND